MKKLLLTLGLVGVTFTGALAQGTIAPLNGVLTRFKIDTADGGALRNVTSADWFSIYVFYGPSRDELVRAPGVATIGTTAGVMVGLPSIMPLPGTEPGQVVAMQIRACNPLGWFAETEVRQVTLGTMAEGTVIWQTSDIFPNRFTPLVAPNGTRPPDFCVPEPSTIALGALFGAFLLFRIRKSTQPN